MHLIKDENGNLVQHGHGHTHEHTHEDGMTHTHEHTHGEGHDHGHSHTDHACDTAHCGSCSEGDCKNETLALLTYMLQHNEHHAQELDQMADNLAKMGMDAACKTIKEAVAENVSHPESQENLKSAFPEYPDNLQSDPDTRKSFLVQSA